jgi:predicted DNA-binding protein YlxM (UPF0122 family)
MELDKVYEISMLIDFYGKLLKEKHFTIVQLYYCEDFSLREIAEQFDITRQGVHDILKRSVDKLRKFESQLNLLERFRQNRDFARQIRNHTEKLKDAVENKNIDIIKSEMDILNDLSEKLMEE